MSNIISTSPFADESYGISQRALAVARALDRLPTGEYQLRVEKKPHENGGGWFVEFTEATTIKVMELAK